MLRSKITILWLSLGLLSLLSQMGLMAEDRWEPYVMGEKQNKAVKTTLINNTKYNKIGLYTDAASIKSFVPGIGAGKYAPLGTTWVNPGEKREEESENFAPEGNGYLYYTKDPNPGAVTSASWYKIDLKPQSGTEVYKFPNNLKVTVKSEPIKIYYPKETNPKDNKTYTFYNYTIIVSPDVTK